MPSSNRYDESTDEAPDDPVAQALVEFDRFLAGEEPSFPGLATGPGGQSEPANAEGLADVCRFLVTLEQAWPRPRPEANQEASSGAEAWQALEWPPAAGSGPPRLGRFTLIEELGRGGYGVVLLAEDPAISRRVALKVPRPEALLTPELRRRFVREARASASLSHPSIVGVYEAGEIGPVCYIASAYSPGTNLATWLAGRVQAVPPRVAATVVAILADAVQHAHSRGVLHRDIKPSNVLLEDLGEGQTCGEPPLEPLAWLPKLCDFGMAKLVHREARESLATLSGQMLGTPAYMAPEQIEGSSAAGAPSADLYGLGTVLYELLTGRAPHVGATHLEILRRIVDDPVVDPRRLRSDIDRDLAAICTKCLEKNPNQRYPSAAALGEDLRRYLAGLPVTARPVSPLTRALRWSRREPRLAAVSAALLLTVGLGFTGVVWQWRRAEASLVAMQAERQRAEEHWLEENRLVSELFRASEDDTPDRRPLLRSTARQRLLGRYQAIVRQAAAGGYTNQEVATAYTKYAVLLGRSETEPGGRIDLVNRGLAMWRELAAVEPNNLVAALGLADAETDAASVLIEEPDLRGAATHAENAAALLGRPELRGDRFEEERYRLGVVLRRIATAWLRVADTEARKQLARTAYRRAADYWRTLVEQAPQNPAYLAELTDCLEGLADGEANLSNWKAAIASRQESLRLEERRALIVHDGAARRRSIGWSHYAIANWYEKLEDREAAATAYRQAERCLQEALLVNSPRASPAANADAHRGLGMIYDSLGDSAQAAEHFSSAAELFGQLCAEFPESRSYRKNQAEVVFWLARMQSETGQPQASGQFERACALAEKLVQDSRADRSDRIRLARGHMIYARYLLSRDQPAQAREHFAQAAPWYRELLAADPTASVFADSLAECEAFLHASSD